MKLRKNYLIVISSRETRRKDKQIIKRFVGLSFTVKEYKDVLHINSLFANEFAESQYIKKLRGSLAKVKANIVQVLPELIENAGKFAGIVLLRQ